MILETLVEPQKLIPISLEVGVKGETVWEGMEWQNKSRPASSDFGNEAQAELNQIKSWDLV